MSDNNLDLQIGDVLYRIERAETKTFYKKCRVCEGTGQLTVNGVTFKCPQCDIQEKTAQVHSYRVVRYRIFSITEEMPYSDWKPSTLRVIKYGLYHKHGQGHCYSSQQWKTEMYKSVLFRYLDNPLVDTYNADRVFFSDYKLAVKCADRLTEESIAELKLHNQTHGTDYELPVFNVEHDKKSK